MPGLNLLAVIVIYWNTAQMEAEAAQAKAYRPARRTPRPLDGGTS